GEGQGSLALVPPERSRVPDADRPIGAGRCEAQAVGAERHAPAPVGVSAQAENLPSGGCVPDTDRLVFAARSQAPALRAECDALDVSGMQVERVEDFAGPRIRQFRGPVEAGRGQQFTVRAERQRGDGLAAMCVDGAKHYSCFWVPELQVLPEGAGRQAPVAAECHGDRMDVVPGQAVKELTVLPIPDL